MTNLSTRRSALRFAAALTASVALPALLLRPAVAQTPRRLTPAQSEGPFYPDQALTDADADLLKNGAVDYKAGQPAWANGVVSDLAGEPVSGAVVEIWQCDHEGVYRHSHSFGRAPMAFQGFGKVQVGADGRYRFRTIKPVPYPGWPPHIHVKIKPAPKSCSPRRCTWRASRPMHETSCCEGCARRNAACSKCRSHEVTTVFRLSLPSLWPPEGQTVRFVRHALQNDCIVIKLQSLQSNL